VLFDTLRIKAWDFIRTRRKFQKHERIQALKVDRLWTYSRENAEYEKAPTEKSGL